MTNPKPSWNRLAFLAWRPPLGVPTVEQVDLHIQAEIEAYISGGFKVDEIQMQGIDGGLI